MSSRYLATSLALIPIVGILLFIFTYGGQLPYWDQWDTPGRLFSAYFSNELKVDDFFAQHNEARKATTSLLWFLLGVDGWNVRHEMVLSVLLVALIPLLLSRASKFTPIWIVPFYFVLFNPYGLAQPWLWGVNLENALLVFLLSAGIHVNSSDRPIEVKYVIATACSVLGTFTFPNGALLWVLLYPGMRTVFVKKSFFNGAERLFTYLYGVVFVLILWSYFSNYVHPGHHPSMLDALQRFSEVVWFFLAWLGAPLSPVLGSVTHAALVGALALVTWAILIIIAFTQLRSNTLENLYPWLIVGIYTVVSGAVVAAGRLGLGIEVSLSNRYLLHVSMFYVSLLGISMQLATIQMITAATQKIFKLSLVITLAITSLVLIQWLNVQIHLRAYLELTTRGETALRFVHIAHTNPDLQRLHPDSEQLIRLATEFQKQGLLNIEFEPATGKLTYSSETISLREFVALETTPNGLRVTGDLTKTPISENLTHLLVVSDSEGGKLFFNVIPLNYYFNPPVPLIQPVVFDANTTSLPAGKQRITLLGYDSASKQVYKTDIEAVEFEKLHQ